MDRAARAQRVRLSDPAHARASISLIFCFAGLRLEHVFALVDKSKDDKGMRRLSLHKALVIVEMKVSAFPPPRHVSRFLTCASHSDMLSSDWPTGPRTSRSSLAP